MLDKHATKCALMSAGVSAEAAAIAREAAAIAREAQMR